MQRVFDAATLCNPVTLTFKLCGRSFVCSKFQRNWTFRSWVIANLANFYLPSRHALAFTFYPLTLNQGCSLGLERLGLETVSRSFLERLGLVLVLKVERLGLVSVSRVWKNRTSRSHLDLEGSTSWCRLGLEDITSRSRVSWLWVLSTSMRCISGLRIDQEENNGSDPQETGCQVTDFTS